MRRLIVFVLLCAFAAGCDQGSQQATPAPATPRLEVTTAQLRDAALSLADVASKWEADENAAPSTVQVGGRVGPANIEDAEAQATTAFKEKEGTAYLSNSLFLVSSEEIAHAVMVAHQDADSPTRWVQDREDGGRATFRHTGTVSNLPTLGDESYSAVLSVKIIEADGKETKRSVEYVAYRVNRVLAFVVAQNARASVYARRQERNVSSLVTS